MILITGGLGSMPGALLGGVLIGVTEALAARAPATAPRPGLVHGDFRLGNVLWDDGRAAALVDWEIWSIGDPRSDLGWLCVFADGARFPGVGRTVPGAPSADEVAERYLARAGLGAADLDWFRALGELKIAAVAAHNLRRHAEGRYRDPHYERMAAGIEPHLEAAARRLGA